MREREREKVEEEKEVGEDCEGRGCGAEKVTLLYHPGKDKVEHRP